VLESDSELVVEDEFMHPKITPGLKEDPKPSVSEARFPSEDEASA